jgi:hypothetical protein
VWDLLQALLTKISAVHRPPPFRATESHEAAPCAILTTKWLPEDDFFPEMIEELRFALVSMGFSNPNDTNVAITASTNALWSHFTLTGSFRISEPLFSVISKPPSTSLIAKSEVISARLTSANLPQNIYFKNVLGSPDTFYLDKNC